MVEQGNDAVEQTLLEEQTLLQECTDATSLSWLSFLFADLRLLSCTGRIYTKFEQLTVESDFLPRASSKHLSCIYTDDDYKEDNVKTFPDSPDKFHSVIRKEMSMRKDEGISVPYFMAIMLLELRRHVSEELEKVTNVNKKKWSPKWSRQNRSDEEDEEDGIISTIEKKEKTVTDETIHTRMLMYAHMFGRDLIDSVHDVTKKMERHEPKKADLHKSVYDVTNRFFSMAQGHKQGLGMSIFQDNSVHSEEEVCAVLEKAIESRDYEKLEFMSSFFREGTSAHFLAKNKARIVWINDYYPLKDLAYIVLVDEEKRRVCVSFRGCTTRHDWNYAFDFNQVELENPVQDDFEDKSQTIKIHKGFYKYLFRKRKDNSHTKFEEICNVVHRYGLERIGPDYKLFVMGHSMGAALATLFSFYASCDERFTKNGPVRALGSGSPYVGGHTFADAFRYQESMKRLEHIRMYCHNDVVSHVPPNMSINKRGSKFTHVGISVKLKPVVFMKKMVTKNCSKWEHEVYYVGREGFSDTYLRAIRRNFILALPFPTRIKNMHTIFEVQKRIMDSLLFKEHNDDDTNDFDKTITELYAKYLERDP